MRHYAVPVSVLSLIASIALSAQNAAPTFEIVSIKRNLDPTGPRGMRTTPSGEFITRGGTIYGIVKFVEPRVTGEVRGLPDWAMRDRYDVQVKTAIGSPVASEALPMWQAMFADRFKMIWHVETQRGQAYRLVKARDDGRLGAGLMRSTLDCGAPTASTSSAERTLVNAGTRCGMATGNGVIRSGGVTLQLLAQVLRPFAGAEVTDGTNLEGLYAVELTFSPAGVASGPPQDRAVDVPPDLFSAVQQQLGLRLESIPTEV